jgi:uncharacterized protein
MTKSVTKLVIFGAGGRAGRAAVAEASRRGLDVTALTRADADVTDATAVRESVAGHDAVISAAAVYGPDTDPDGFFRASALALLASRPKRLVVVGLSSILTDEHGARLMDAPGFPREFHPFCHAHEAGLELLRTSDIDWLYASPAGDFGAGQGGYQAGEFGDPINRISYEDFAVALIDEVQRPKHHRVHMAVRG